MITDFTRQEELIKPYSFRERITIIGCGALGSWLAMFLLKMGFKDIHVYDFDIVEEHNIPNQLFAEEHIGMAKTDALYQMYTKMFDDTDAETNRQLNVHFTKIDEDNAAMLGGVVFSCVDSMKARKEIYETCYKYGKTKLWIEGRIGLWGAFVYTLANKDSTVLKKYEETLYGDEEAEVSACGISQTALPAAVNCASIMLMQMIKWHRANDTLSNEIRYSIPDLIAEANTWNEFELMQAAS